MLEPGDPPFPGRLVRHDLLLVEPPFWRAALQDRPALLALPVLAEWAGRGRPVMARRPQPGDGAPVPVAVALPRSTMPHRIALALPWAAIRRRSPPPRLAEVAPPAGWRQACDALLAIARSFAIEPRVFGSLMWQHETGLPYLAPTSDLDLLWPVQGGEEITDLCRAIAGIEARTGLRIDGELIGPDGAAVHWREYGAGADEVMVKTMQGVLIRRRDACFRASTTVLA